jgi:hypothetical protein
MFFDSFGLGTFSFSNCHIIGLDTGSLVLIVFGLKSPYQQALLCTTVWCTAAPYAIISWKANGLYEKMRGFWFSLESNWVCLFVVARFQRGLLREQMLFLWAIMATGHIMLKDLSELFGPGHFVGLGLRLKSEIRTRTWGSDLRNRDFPTPWPKIISQWNTYDVLL